VQRNNILEIILREHILLILFLCQEKYD